MTDVLNIYFDLDDTLFDTISELRKYLLNNHGFVSPVDSFLTLENTNGLIQHVLDNPMFMKTVNPYPEMVDLLNNIRNEYGNSVSINCCSHRGYHPLGVQYTLSLLLKHNLHFDDKVFLNPYKDPDKIKYLRSSVNTNNLMLIDDNPKFDVSDETYDVDVYVIDKPWNNTLDFGNNRVYSPDCIMDKINNRLK